MKFYSKKKPKFIYSFLQPSARPTPTQQPNPAGAFPFGLGGIPGMGNLNFADTNFGDIQQQFQQQVIQSKGLNKSISFLFFKYLLDDE